MKRNHDLLVYVIAGVALMGLCFGSASRADEVNLTPEELAAKYDGEFQRLKRFEEQLRDAREMGDRDKMLEILSNALTEFPKITDLLLERGRTLQEKGRFQEAIRDFSKVADDDQFNRFALVAKAQCESALGQDEIALADVTVASSMPRRDPSMNLPAWMGKVALLRKLGRYAEADKEDAQMRRFFRLSPLQRMVAKNATDIADEADRKNANLLMLQCLELRKIGSSLSVSDAEKLLGFTAKKREETVTSITITGGVTERWSMIVLTFDAGGNGLSGAELWINPSFAKVEQTDVRKAFGEPSGEKLMTFHSPPVWLRYTSRSGSEDFCGDQQNGQIRYLSMYWRKH